MKIRDIELGNISRYRGELMGAAMLFVILFHINLPRTDVFFGLRRMGNIGVDMFFFLSGIGLWFSWGKLRMQKTVSEAALVFFKRRYLRIYPAWLIIACLYYIPRFHGGDWLAWVDLIGDITINWDFWLHDELTFWYIPATMMLYLFAPAYMELIRRHPLYRWLPVLMIVWCVIVQWVLPIHQTVGHLEIFWSRIPIFFIGLNAGEYVLQKERIDGHVIWMIVLSFIMILSACIYLEQMRHGKFPLFVERMLYIPLTITGILLLNIIFEKVPQWMGKLLRFIGLLSLELYLIHVHFVLVYVEKWGLPYWGKFVVCILITIPLAWVLSKIVEYIEKVIGK